ncbi:MAG: FKBP-type peptidyl-prolyl cis-trans isomerase [Pyrinomonadaceae bacterium]|nr:FKBP-type peptidyl-prolyl cis-trans isomerase [Sphingobacteriaceae bacterium]
MLLSVNDSALVKIPTDSIFVNPQMQRPPFLPQGSSITMIIKVLKVQSMEEAMAEQQKVMAEMKSKEELVLQKYLLENKTPTIKTASGLRYRVTKPSVKAKPLAGDTVLVNYIGKTLAGKVFDSSIGAEAKKAGLQQGDRVYEPISVVLGQRSVIPGWEEGLLLLNEGAKATFIIPSELAYGPQGASDDIKPFTPLLFDIEVVKVKRAKKAAPVVKKAVPSKSTKPGTKTVSKPVAKKPVAKTTTKK